MEKRICSTNSIAAESQSSRPLEKRSSRYSPWPFVLLALLMLACMGATASIVVISNGKPVSSWTVEPAVLLAIISSIWNYTAGSMLGIAVTITWWRKFLQGTTVRNLHYIWKRGVGLSWLAAFRASIDARNIVLLASLIFLVQAVNNPLLQRTSHVEAKNVTVGDNLMLKMVSLFPDGLTSLVTNATAQEYIGLPAGMLVNQGWWLNETMVTSNATGFQCDGVCKGNVQGTGLKVKCNSTTTILDLVAPENMGSAIFEIETTPTVSANGAPILVLKTVHPATLDDSCKATLTVDTCIFEAALVEYPIVIQGTAITLDPDLLDNMTILSDYTAPGDVPTGEVGQKAGPLQSINDFFYYVSVDAVLQSSPVSNGSIYSGGFMADLFYQADESYYSESIVGKCRLLFSSPTSYATRFMHEFLFRTLLLASTDTDIQTFGVQHSSVQLIFRSNYHYLIAVLAAMLAALLCLLSQVWAFWELGWNVTMSPIETATAFGAPALWHGRFGASEDILKVAGDNWVTYGN